MDSLVCNKKKDGDSGCANQVSRLRTMPLIELVSEIVNKSDPGALHEIHNNRTIFRYHNGPPLLMVQYLTALKKETTEKSFSNFNTHEVSDKAYDLTLDKFNNMPEPTTKILCGNKKNGNQVKQDGSDCRLYYQAFLRRCAKSFRKRSPQNEIAREIQAAGILQGLVKRHYYRSLLEAERSLNPFRSRYNWKIRGVTLTVYLPVSIEGTKRREWLEGNIKDSDPHRRGEKERIQAIINCSFTNQRMVRIEDENDIADSKDHSITCLDKDKKTSLAEIVAQEKADNINKQRPAVRAIGKKKLKQLILRVFNEITDKDYADGKVAQGVLSKSAFSRFAGSKWKKNGHNVPDLWRNTAYVLSKNASFNKIAAKYKEQISLALNGNDQQDENKGEI
jgi:hypothetical protein